MGKGSETRARARKLAKKHSLPTIAPTKSSRPKKRGGPRQRELEAERMTLTLATRARQMGRDPAKPEQREAMKAPIYGCEAGRAIALYCESAREARQSAASMFQVVRDWRQLEGRFLALCISRRVYEGKDSIPHLPEPMETRDDVDYDLRAPEEKERAARNAWASFDLDSRILSEEERRIAWRGVWAVEGMPMVYLSQTTGKPRLTRAGMIFALAIRKLDEALQEA